MRIMIAGGGLAGLAAAAALGSIGFEVDLHEARPFLGGRATSFPVSPSDPDSERIDNCQHILLRCCSNLLDFYRRCGAIDKIRFSDEYHFVEPGGCVSRLKAGLLPAPLHFTGPFLRFAALGWPDKLAIARGLRAMTRKGQRPDLEAITFHDWLTARPRALSSASGVP